MDDRVVGPTLHLHLAPGARTGLVLLHGVMSHAGWFDPLARQLNERGLSVAAVDRRGSGAAREREGGCDPAAWIDDAKRAIARLRQEVERVALFGWCWGARTAVLAAGDADHLILAAPGLAMTEAIRTRAKEIAQGTEDPSPLPFELSAFSDDVAVLATLRNDPLAWKHQPRAFLQPSAALLGRALAELPLLPRPVTTLLAANDRIVDNDGVKKIVGDRPVEVLAGGHALVLESPAQVADRCLAILTR